VIVPQGAREVLPDCVILSRMNGRRLALNAVVATAVMAGCAGKISFDNAAPGTPLRIEGRLYKPDGAGPFPALVLLHGCQGILRQTETWAHWLRARGYVALAVDSFGPRHDPADCKDGAESGPSTARFDDAIGALRYLQTQPFVIPDRVASFGWSQGGLFAMSVINGPTLERARARGVTLPRAGYAAAIAMYPGGCEAYVKELVIRPLLLLIGGADNWTPPQYCREMAAAMKARGADVTLVEYPGAYHYFDVVGQKKEVLKDIEQPYTSGTFGVTIAYDPAAAADASRRVEDFLSRTLKAAPAR
jgi:dienelactone hydrolase